MSLIYQQPIRQCPVLVVGIGIGIVGRFAVHATGIDEGAGGTEVLQQLLALEIHAGLLQCLESRGDGIVDAVEAIAKLAVERTERADAVESILPVE